MESDHEAEPRAKPKHLTPENAAAFRLPGVAEHYPLRPPYPEEVVQRLKTGGVVLEMGCGTGELSRRLAPFARRVVAVDPSAAMLARARGLPGGGAVNIEWIQSSAEEFDYPERYDLILTPQSLHWMDWEVVLPKFARALDGALAIIPTCHARTPWGAELKRVVPNYSTMKNFDAYDLIEELERRGLFACEERIEVGPHQFRQTLDDYVGAWWSRAGFARLDSSSAAEFAAEVRKLVEPHARDGWIEVPVFADLALGKPLRS
ncbi:MAG: class I SAM-dependent methyltransferase [Planctomycetota bacterium]|jgi:SAM-dependent methyltransferase